MTFLTNLARRSIRQLVARSSPPMRCTGCNKERSDERQFISGPGFYICGDCVRTAAETLAPRQLPPDAVRCQFCRQYRAPKETTSVGLKTICADCLGSMRSMLHEVQAST